MSSSMEREVRRRSMYCMSETSPPKPTTLDPEKVRRRLTSLNRASEPYDAVWKGLEGPYSADLRVPTKVVCSNDNTVFEFECDH